MIVELLAADTSEATHVWRVGNIVYKLMRPVESFASHCNHRLRCSAADRVRQLHARAAESLRPPLNPVLYIEPLNLWVSRYIEGVPPTPEELQRLVTGLERAGRFYKDVTRWNVIVSPHGPVVIDF